MWITITVNICSALVSLLCIALGYLLMAGSIGADANLVTFTIKAGSDGVELNGWGFTPGLALAAFGCFLEGWALYRSIGSNPIKFIPPNGATKK
jgi:hypothetical protein